MKTSCVALFLYCILCSLALWSSALNTFLEAEEDLKLPAQISKGQQIHGMNQVVEMREGEKRNYQVSRKAQRGKGANGGSTMAHKHRQCEKNKAIRPCNSIFSISILSLSYWVLIIFGFACFSL